MNIIRTTLFWALVVGVLAWIARPAAPIPTDAASTGNGRLAARETSFSFGTISMARGTVRHGFSVTNTGTVPVKIMKTYTSCMCTTATFFFGNDRLGPFGMPGHGFVPPVNRTVAPGETFTLETTFDPAAHGPSGIGRIARTVTLEVADGAPLVFGFDAIVTP